MSDQENPTEESGAVRRVGRKDRKAKIERRGSLFPDEEPREPADDSAWMPPESAGESAAEEDERSAVVEAPPESSAEPRASRPRRGRFPPMPDELERLERRAAAQRAAAAAAQPDPRRAAQIAQMNQITAALLALTLILGIYIGILWVDPYSPLNLFAPPTPLPIFVSMTPTPSPTLTPTFTLTPSPTLTPSRTPTPSETPSPVPTETFTPIPPEALGITTLPGANGGEPEGGFTFRLIPAGLIYIANPEARGGCNWSSIVGSVVDANGRAVDGYIVRIQGEGVDEAVITGTARGFGAGGYELPLGSQAREAVYTVTLFDSTGRQVAASVTANTRADCANITAVRFVEIVSPG